ncbi:MAG: hypothetical protein Q8909_20770 [Bacteroidota bacterium]|nr:hypothetical protein [Bacteroidota bacterium]
MKNKILNFYIALTLLVGCFSCGSYYYAEEYSTNMSCDKFIKKLDKFKETYPQYKCTQTNDKGGTYEKGTYYYYSKSGGNIETSTRTDSSTFYSFYLHFSDIKADIHCVINVSTQNPNTSDSNCTVQLTGVTYSHNWASWKTINNFKEISREENKKIKRKFETEILQKLLH